MSFNQNIVSKLNAWYYPHPPRDPLDAAFCAFATPGMKILDAACSDRGLCIKAPLKEMYIVGIDIDPAVHNNPTCDESIVHDLSKTFPFEDDSFDMIHCRWAIEHLEYPEKAFCEFARILKPGGKLICLTPNIFHYATIAARLTPHWFHRWWRQGGEELFSTYYRANCPRKLRSLCMKVGLRVERLELIESPPYYSTRYWPVFLCAVLYEHAVNSTRILSWMRHSILLEATSRL